MIVLSPTVVNYCSAFLAVVNYRSHIQLERKKKLQR